MQRKEISLSKIRIDGGTQMRVSIDADTVETYAEDFDNLPPAVVFHDGSDYWLGDGFHRYHGARKAGRSTMPVEVRNGTLRDAILYAVGANADHGLRRSNADKRRAVATLLVDKEWGKFTDNRIATQCRVSNHFVTELRKAHLGTFQDAPPLALSKTAISQDGDTSIDDDVFNPPAPAISQQTETKIKAIEDKGGKPKVAERNGKTYAIDTAKIGKTKDVKVEEKAEAKEPPPADEPWRDVVEEAKVLISKIRSLSRECGAFFDFDPDTKRSRKKYMSFIHHAGVCGNLNATVRSIEESLPARLSDKPPGYIPISSAKIQDGVKGGRAA